MTHGPADIRALLDDHELRPSRALGQNFVADANTVRRIVRLAGVEADRPVVEIGAGLGSLTLALVEAGAPVTAVEIDRYVAPVLRSLVEPLGARVVEADALTLDWTELLGTAGSPEASPGPWTLVANLPYNVAVPLVVRVLETAPAVHSLTVMVQREVGERMAAGPGDPAYGAVSVKIAYWTTASVVGRVPASVFIPRPKVESVLVRLDRRAIPGGQDWIREIPYAHLFALVRRGFAQRRKMLRRALAGVVDPEAFARAGVAPTDRAEALDLEAWGRLAQCTPETATADTATLPPDPEDPEDPDPGASMTAGDGSPPSSSPRPS